MSFSKPSYGGENSKSHVELALTKSDWRCMNCGAHNFKRRDICFKCSAEKKDNIGMAEGLEDMSLYPTSTLLFLNLDTLSTEDSVLHVVSGCATLPIKKIKIAKDALTGISQGFCYVEMHSVDEAMQLHNLLSVPGKPLVIDDKEVQISYARTSATYMPRTQSTNIANAALAAAQWSNQAMPDNSNGYGLNNVQCYDQYYNQQPYGAVNNYHGDYYQPYQPHQQHDIHHSQGDSINTAAAVAHNALKQMHAAKEIQKTQLQIQEHILAKIQSKDQRNESEMSIAEQAALWSKRKQTDKKNVQSDNNSGRDSGSYNDSQSSFQCTVTGDGYTKYPVPDMSTYIYDDTSGYYYDNSTGLYYDASTQYYYNSDTQSYLYWDGEHRTYVSASTVSGASNQNDDEQQSADSATKKDKGRDKQDKVKIAKKIAKDMEKWAKTLNQRKDYSKPAPASLMMSKNYFDHDIQSSSSTDVCFSMLEKKTSAAERHAAVYEAMKKNDLNENVRDSGGLVPEYGGGSDSEDDESKLFSDRLKQEESKLLDWTKIACLLCKRQFPNAQTLQKHQQMSDLHKQNLEILKKSKFTDKEIADNKDREMKYRDRAKERRMKYGEPEPPKSSKLKDAYYRELKHKETTAQSSYYEEPTKKGIGDENVGNKMLKAMGWNEGQGLGRTNQGMTDIIQAQKRNVSAGLGMKGGTVGAIATDSYRDTVKKMMRSRYKDIDS